MFIVESPRWRDVYFDLNESQIPILYKVKGRLDTLRSVRLSVVDRYGCRRERQLFFDLFMDAPQLTRTYLTEYDWQLDWSAVTVIHIDLMLDQRLRVR